MKLLIFTQKIDRKDQVLGFFHGWVYKMSQKFEFIYIVCIEKGEFDLPSNVQVYSLGKEFGFRKIKYVFNFLKYLYKLNNQYNKVFVHMNQEYILLGGLYWNIIGIPVYFWRNHLRGSLLTKISVWFSNKVFYTSPDSYTSKFDKSILMPVGIDIDLFKEQNNVVRKKYSIGMVGRISPVKNIELGIRAVKILIDSGVQVSFSIIGPVLIKDKKYFDNLINLVRELKLEKVVSFSDGVSFDKLPSVYSSFEIYLNLTQTGSFDKTIIEATSCGAMPLVINESLKGMLPEICISNKDEVQVASSINKLLQAGEQVKIHKDLETFVQKNSLDNLVGRITEVLKN